MRHPSRPVSAASAFLVGVLITLGSRGTAAVAADEVLPCTAPVEAAANVAPETSTGSGTNATVSPPFRISELLPDPAGKDADGEFIEIENVADVDAEIEGWRIADAKGKTYVIPAMRIAAHGSRAFVYAETKISLVNAAAWYALQDASGVIVDTASYPSPVPEGKSYARFDGGWRWTETPTAGATNVLSETAAAPAMPEPAPPNEPSPAPMPEPTLPEPDPTPTPVTRPIAVTINEILPDPDGDDGTEWVELRNDGADDAALAGWLLDDAPGGSAPYAFTAERVPAGGFLIVPSATSRLALNNDADEVRLIAPDASVRQSIRYENAPTGKSFAYDGAQWRWTTMTSGEANRFDDVLTDIVAGAEASVTAPAEEEPDTATTVEEAAALDDGTMVALSGIVTLPPGVIGKTILAIRDADGTHGAFVRIRGKTAVPTLMPGDIVALRGRIRREAGSLLAVNAKDVRKTGYDGRDVKSQRDPASVSEDDVGLVVSIAGTVTAKGAGWVRLGAEGDGTEIRGTIAKGVAVGTVEVGDTATMTGVARLRSGKMEIVVFEKDAFLAKKRTATAEHEHPTTSTALPTEGQETIVLSAANASPMTTTWTVVAVISLGGSIAGYALWKRRRFA